MKEGNVMDKGVQFQNVSASPSCCVLEPEALDGELTCFKKM
jgi:hypothetical protein